MPRNNKPTYQIEQLLQIQALATPARQEILDALETVGPAPVTAIAAVLGRAPDSLYHHLRVLQKVGLVKLVETRAVGRIRETIYDLAGPSMTLTYELADPAHREALNALVRGMSRMARRDFERATESDGAVTNGPRRNLRSARMVGRLDHTQIEKINELYDRIAEIMLAPSADGQPADFVALTFQTAPLERRSGSD
jgi:DNA-binding transcriptional ArsR family regulator